MTISDPVVPVLALFRRLVSKWKFLQVDNLVTCPENRRPAGVRVAPFHQLASCSRWPEHAGCGQQCLSEIEAAPEDCRVRTILERWYEGKSCVVCHAPFEKIHWAVQKPALRSTDGSTVEWNRIAVEQLPDLLAASSPVCFACHMAGTLVRQHPDLAIDRSRRFNS